MSDASTLIRDLKTPWRHGEHVDARGRVLEDPLTLDGLSLCGVDLSGAHLKAGLTARGATFQGLAWLKDTRIDGQCDFTSAQFRIDLRAEGLTADQILLDNTQIRGVLALARARARRISATGAIVMANLTLEGAHVSEIDLSQSTLMGGLWAEGARTQRFKTDGAEISGRIRHSSEAPLALI